MGMKKWKPMFFETSFVPKLISKFAPIDIWAISLCGLVFCRGNLSPRVRRHETIHFQQQLEMLFVTQLILYVAFWLFGLIKYRNGSIAYYENPFEREAYQNDADEEYLENRPRYAWIKYIRED